MCQGLPGGADEMANLEHPPEANVSPDASHALRLAATVLRTLFIVLLLVLTLRVSLPQSETIWTAYDTPADLVRLILGLGVCAWLVYQLFLVPKDADSSRTWFYLGLVAVPFTLIVLFVAW
jgi:TRAP-type C4-dicarboxylate transport system permease small subunit